MIVGPTQFTPMYWAPRGSWWAHISSRTAGLLPRRRAPPAELLGPGHAQQPRSASSRQKRWATSRSAGSSVNAPRKSGGDVLGDQPPQLRPQRGDRRPHGRSPRRRPSSGTRPGRSSARPWWSTAARPCSPPAYRAVQPPSTTIVWPVAYRPASRRARGPPRRRRRRSLVGQEGVPAQPLARPSRCRRGRR